MLVVLIDRSPKMSMTQLTPILQMRGAVYFCQWEPLAYPKMSMKQLTPILQLSGAVYFCQWEPLVYPKMSMKQLTPILQLRGAVYFCQWEPLAYPKMSMKQLTPILQWCCLLLSMRTTSIPQVVLIDRSKQHHWRIGVKCFILILWYTSGFHWQK
jgi:hypothetical protein